MRDGAPLFAVECKTGWLIQGVRVLPFAQLCDELHLP